MRVKRDKIVLIVSVKKCNNDNNPCTLAPQSFSSPKRDTFQPVGPSVFCCHFSNISMSQKYHNIKNKCNPFTKQWAINNNQVVFLYCICTVYTQRVKFVVYMYTKTTGSLFQTGFLSIAYNWNSCPDFYKSQKKQQHNNLHRILESRRDNAQWDYVACNFRPPKIEGLERKGNIKEVFFS